MSYSITRSFFLISFAMMVATFLCGLSSNELQILQNLTINKTSDINNFAHLATFEDEVFEFLKSLGNTDENAQIACKIMHKIVSNSLVALHAQAAWVTIRSFKPNEIYNLPRWHTDGYYFQPFSGVCYKIVCALQGANTLFVHVPDAMRVEFFAIQSRALSGIKKTVHKNLSKKDSDYIRRSTRMQRVDLLKDFSVQAATAGQGTVFIIGDREKSAIHSEPPMHEDRLFMSIVPGTYEQIESLYPRWSIK
jgi:hypothetical protein